MTAMGNAPIAKNTIAKVLVPLPFAEPFDYLIPEDINVKPGNIVQAPFGKRDLWGIVVDLVDSSTTPEGKLKPLYRIHDTYEVSPQDIKFLMWMANYTLIPQGQILKMLLSTPAALDPQKQVLGYKPSTAPSSKEQKLTDNQKRILDILHQEQAPLTSKALQEKAGVSAAVLKTAHTKGLLETVSLDAKTSINLKKPDANFANMTYSPDQQKVVDALTQKTKAHTYETILVHGVTGSGKTEVYFEAIAENLRQGRQSLVLLPEISLTAQWLERFGHRFGTRPLTWHSQMTPARRRDAWRDIATGKAQVIVGARSALMLPYKNLGAIIIDEEHEGSYKQEEAGIYHARDMAVAKAYHLNIPVLLVSATPSIESLVNAREGKYTLLELPLRHGGATMPNIDIIDMRSHKKRQEGTPSFLSARLKIELAQALEKGEQSLLFLNRRGYAPLTLCQGCGDRLQCPHCTAWLVSHKGHSQEKLQCHHCGFMTRLPKECSKCDAKDSYVACGPGVERIQEEVQKLLPEARILIMASDFFEATSGIIDAIERIQKGEIDIIIGTQMMAKGHHFPKLTLVGVVDADLGLSGGDPRACEKTFQLLQQVSGRCGRAEKPGHVLLQTYHPDHPVLLALAENKTDFYVDQEITMRQQAQMPPYSKLAALIISGKNPQEVENWVRHLAKHQPTIKDNNGNVSILGPAPAPIAVLRRQYRWRFLIKAPKNYPIQKYIKMWLKSCPCPRHLKLQIDIDPISFM